MKPVSFTLKHGPWGYAHNLVADKVRYTSRINSEKTFSKDTQHVVELTYAALEAVHQ